YLHYVLLQHYNRLLLVLILASISSLFFYLYLLNEHALYLHMLVYMIAIILTHMYLFYYVGQQNKQSEINWTACEGMFISSNRLCVKQTLNRQPTRFNDNPIVCRDKIILWKALEAVFCIQLYCLLHKLARM